jgi:hypothetical protein
MERDAAVAKGYPQKVIVFAGPYSKAKRSDVEKSIGRCHSLRARR